MADHSRTRSIARLQRVIAHAKRRCPRCLSNKWAWLGATPTTLEELGRHLLVRYRCRACGLEFLVEEAKRSRVVRSADQCIHCQSRDVRKISQPGAEVELWNCRRCNAYMIMTEDSLGIEPETPMSQPTVADTGQGREDESKVK